MRRVADDIGPHGPDGLAQRRPWPSTATLRRRRQLAGSELHADRRRRHQQLAGSSTTRDRLANEHAERGAAEPISTWSSPYTPRLRDRQRESNGAAGDDDVEEGDAGAGARHGQACCTSGQFDLQRAKLTRPPGRWGHRDTLRRTWRTVANGPEGTNDEDTTKPAHTRPVSDGSATGRTHHDGPDQHRQHDHPEHGRAQLGPLTEFGHGPDAAHGLAPAPGSTVHAQHLPGGLRCRPDHRPSRDARAPTNTAWTSSGVTYSRPATTA